MRHYNPLKASQSRLVEVFTTPNGLGGVFTVSIAEDLGDERVRVRVNYPSQDWNGYQFETKRDCLTPAGRKALYL